MLASAASCKGEARGPNHQRPTQALTGKATHWQCPAAVHTVSSINKPHQQLRDEFMGSSKGERLRPFRSVSQRQQKTRSEHHWVELGKIPSAAKGCAAHDSINSHQQQWGRCPVGARGLGDSVSQLRPRSNAATPKFSSLCRGLAAIRKEPRQQQRREKQRCVRRTSPITLQRTEESNLTA